MSQSAYLVIREGSKWSDVFRLVPGQSVTIGRAPTNQIVLKDERCSRNHAEVFMSGGQWTLRDLESRNGTIVGDQMVRGDLAAEPGRRDPHRPHPAGLRPSACPRPFLRGRCQHGGRAASRPRHARRHRGRRRRIRRAGGLRADDDHAPPRRRPSFSRRARKKRAGVSKIGRAAAKLCRLAFELAKAPDLAAMADLALAGLFEETQTDAGALLLLPADHQGAAARRRPGSGRLAQLHRRTATTACPTSWPPP